MLQINMHKLSGLLDAKHELGMIQTSFSDFNLFSTLKTTDESVKSTFSLSSFIF